MNSSNVFYLNAVTLLRQESALEPRLRPALLALDRAAFEPGINAAVEDWLANPFVQTALSILKSLNKNYKIGQALKLLEEAGIEEQEVRRKSKKKR